MAPSCSGWCSSACRHGVALTSRTRPGVSLTKDAPAKLAFKYSLIYLFVLFAALAVDHLVG